jgi:hypothetical protein
VIRRGTHVASKSELANLLDTWLQETTEPTIGDVGSYGRQAWIIIDLARGRAQLNADTTRKAARAYLNDVARRGAEVPWQVVPNRNGRVNKVVYRSDGGDVPGWYYCLAGELTGPGDV